MDLHDVFVDIIEGRLVRRSVRDVDVAPGERVPAFALAQGTAHSGWVFWKKFTDTSTRTLFGSAVRSRKGDWAGIIPAGGSPVICAHPGLRAQTDLDQLSSV